MSQQQVLIGDIIFISLIIIFILYKRKTVNKGKGVKNGDIYILCINKLKAKIKRPKGLYIPDQKIISRVENNFYDEMALTALADDILKHCGFRPASLFVSVVDYDPDDHATGQYQIRGNQSSIQIQQLPNMDMDEVLAVLIHECMHFFLHCRGLTMPTTQENEYLTDITGVYMGFGEYMRKGYGRVGYLSKGDLIYVKSIINN